MQAFDYRELLKQKYLAQKKQNSNYSLRKWAEELGMNPGSLSAILQAKRHLSLKHYNKLKRSLELDEIEAKFVLESILKIKIEEQKSLIEVKKMEEDSIEFKVISDWRYFAILNLFHLQDFQWDNHWIAKQLNLEIQECQNLISDLLKIGLIVQETPLQAKRSYKSISTNNDIKSLAIQESHIQRLEMAKSALEIDPLLREFQSHCFCFPKNKIDELKQMIRNFIKEVDQKLETSDADSVGHLNIQFFPVSGEMAQNLNKKMNPQRTKTKNTKVNFGKGE